MYYAMMATAMNIGMYRVVCHTSLLSGSVLFQHKKEISGAKALDVDGFNKDAGIFHVHVANGQIHKVERIPRRGRAAQIKDEAERKRLSELGRKLGSAWEDRMRKRAGL